MSVASIPCHTNLSLFNTLIQYKQNDNSITIYKYKICIKYYMY